MFIFRFMRGLECKGTRGAWWPLPPNPQKTAKNEFKHLPTSNITLPQLSIPTHIKKPRGLLRVTHKTAINGFQNLWGVGTKKPPPMVTGLVGGGYVGGLREELEVFWTVPE